MKFNTAHFSLLFQLCTIYILEQHSILCTKFLIVVFVLRYLVKDKGRLCSIHWLEKVTENFKLINRNKYFSKNGDV